MRLFSTRILTNERSLKKCYLYCVQWDLIITYNRWMQLLLSIFVVYQSIDITASNWRFCYQEQWIQIQLRQRWYHRLKALKKHGICQYYFKYNDQIVSSNVYRVYLLSCHFLFLSWYCDILALICFHYFRRPLFEIDHYTGCDFRKEHWINNVFQLWLFY